MNKKITYLLLALALPGLIFIFLKVFGKNHFDIPVYYKEGISDSLKECSEEYHGQYALPDSVLSTFSYKMDVACLFVDASEINNKEVAQLRQSFGDGQLQIIDLEGIEPIRLNQIKKCVLFMKEPWKAVLVDKQKRIRGYYAFTNLEETDRLNVEVEILLTNN
jgi:protein SCO1/2